MNGQAVPPGSGGSGASRDRVVAYGLKPNTRAFSLVLVQVALVGATVGVERAVLPVLAKQELGVASATASLAFIASFGLAKAPLNFLAGRLADRLGRRRVLVAGWLVASPVPLVIALAPAWEWVVAANALLGAQQGLCWSTSLFMHVDVAGRERRGLAIGVNELFGYGGTALTAYAAGALAAAAGPRLVPFALQEALILVGLGVALSAVPETKRYVEAESAPAGAIRAPGYFAAVCQAGLVTKVADVAAWGLLPLHLLERGLGVATVAALAAAYPALWSVLQPITGALSDRAGRRRPVLAGMACQALGLVLLAAADGVGGWLAGIAALAAGTALVYPVLLAAAGDVAAPSRRASAIGLYRLVRDLGFVAGALLAGGLADAIGAPGAFEALAALSVASGVVAAVAMRPAAASAWPLTPARARAALMSGSPNAPSGGRADAVGELMRGE